MLLLSIRVFLNARYEEHFLTAAIENWAGWGGSGAARGRPSTGRGAATAPHRHRAVSASAVQPSSNARLLDIAFRQLDQSVPRHIVDGRTTVRAVFGTVTR
jgi:hypothetical protein